MAKKICCLAGAGSVTLTPYNNRKDKTANGLQIGNLQMFQLTYESETRNSNIKDTRTYIKARSECQEDIVTGMSLKISSNCFDGYFGEAALAAGIINLLADDISEQHALWKDQIISLGRLPDLAEGIIVTNIAGTTTYEQDIDYEFVYGSGNVQIRSISTGSIANPTVTSGIGANNVIISYTSRLSIRHILGAMTNKFFRVEVAGLGSHGDAYKGVFYRAKFKPSNTLDLISDGMDSPILEIDLDVYPDPEEINVDNGLFKGFGELDMSLLDVKV